MSVAGGVDKFAGLQSADLSHHLQQESIGGDVERHTEEAVGASLIKLKTQTTVSDIELEKRVAWRQIHIREIGDIPCADNDPP